MTEVTVRRTELPLPLIRAGKVREVYAVGETHVLLVASDRISAFDVVMNEPVAHKGMVLTQMSAYWFGILRDRRRDGDEPVRCRRLDRQIGSAGFGLARRRPGPCIGDLRLAGLRQAGGREDEPRGKGKKSDRHAGSFSKKFGRLSLKEKPDLRAGGSGQCRRGPRLHMTVP